MLAALCCPQISYADGLTGAAFLEWDAERQANYLQTQLVMAGSIAARVKPELSECLGKSFFAENGGISDVGLKGILENIRQFPDFHPSSVLVVTMESDCGSF
ncbi:hypothetical protein [uncultured Tateyamaria sp.]|uniref:hypothetical protein n=1 Tax=uncultured Tateyamaria sp. TaxID=455651 RepID=UPI00260C0CEE|nr:hypothetical protein [uncultured Tateyamaria sp.]